MNLEKEDMQKATDFHLLLKKIGKNIGKNISNKNGQELVDSVKKSATNALKTASERAIQKSS